MGDKYRSWININEMHVLTENYMEFADKDKTEFLSKEGNLKYELGVQCEYFRDKMITVNDEIIYFMKEGTVHQPEIFEMVMRGYNIDTSDFVINTANNERYLEPNSNPFSIS